MNYEETTERLNKYLSEKGVCSRREADRLTTAGKITINGRVAQLGDRVSESDTVVVDGTPVTRKQIRPVFIAVNKPAGIVCTTAEFPGETNIIQMVKYPTRIYPIGRLDKDSQGLLLMTNQGGLVNEILKSSGEHEKEYVVTINRQVTPEFCKKMAAGVELPELNTVTKPCIVKKTGNREFHIILKQGLNRQIRRMCEALGCHVENLTRIRIMNITLGNLPSGAFRNITEAEFEQMVRQFHWNN